MAKPAERSVCFKLAIIIALVLCCQPPPRRQKEITTTTTTTPLYRPQRLTLELIKEFHLTSDDLYRLNYFIENALLLHLVQHSGSNQVTQNGEVDLKRKIDEEEIVFEHMAPGTAQTIWTLSPFNYFGYRAYRISVQFERWPNQSLIFEPNIWGEYVVKESWWSWGNHIVYEDRSYSRSLPDLENYLLIDTRLLEDIKHRRRVVPGRK